MSIEKITSKILSDAEGIASAALNEAKNAGDAIVAEAAEKAEQKIKDAEEKGADQKEKMISRRKAVAQIDGRKIILQEKQKLIEESFEQAVEKVTSMKKDEYVAFLASMVENTGYKEGELIFNEKEAAEIGNDVIAKVSKDLPNSNIVLSKETQKLKGGFLLKKGSVYINGTIDALVDEAKEQLINEVADILFQ